ncbi:MAG: nucleotidyltransferase family protein [Acidobacteriaceae bacterium]|nr:nucleotidyltransferase family protein [Acidobacteriaceae bacterium]
MAREIADWDALTTAAEYHGLTALLCRLLEESCPDLVAQDVASLLRKDYRDSAARNLILTSQMFSLVDLFQAKGVNVLALKGPVLAELLYPDPVLRPFSDLDLLVRKQDVAHASSILAQEGYALSPHLARLSLRTLLRLNYALLFRHGRGAYVDLQWEVGPSDYPFRFDMEILWRSSSQTRIDGREVACLSPESLLLYLCVHGTKHMWSRLLWMGDVARLVRTPLNWPEVLALAAEAKCSRPLLLGLLLAHELLEAPLPEEVLQLALSTQAVQLRATQATRRLLCAQPSEPRSWEFTVFNARMAERSWEKVRHCASMLKAPTEWELEILPLPERLFFLYYPVRLARIALKYGSRLTQRLPHK